MWKWKCPYKSLVSFFYLFIYSFLFVFWARDVKSANFASKIFWSLHFEGIF